jgi:hypothetical protein
VSCRLDYTAPICFSEWLHTPRYEMNRLCLPRPVTKPSESSSTVGGLVKTAILGGRVHVQQAEQPRIDMAVATDVPTSVGAINSLLWEFLPVPVRLCSQELWALDHRGGLLSST